MPTTAQIFANRLNSRKSTGPQTAEGKAVVSQNAVKHGIFAESVIKGEDPADYEAFHNQFFAEWAPVGVVESVLAERFVSLAWRLKRADQMQNQAIDHLIEHQITDPKARRHRECYYLNQGIRPEDPRFDLDNLPLGRIATSDWSNCRVLDRMLMYERRIENSMIKIMKELKRFQVIRRMERQDAEKQREPSPSQRDEAATRPNSPSQSETATRPTEIECDLKKQSQFTQTTMDVTSYAKGDYDNKPVHEIEENKANQSQLQTRAALEGDQSIHRSDKIQG